MTDFIFIPPEVTPLLYSGLERAVRRLAEELTRAFDTPGGENRSFQAPLDRMNLTCELMRVIDWPKDFPPTEATVEVGILREIMLGGLEDELLAQRDRWEASGDDAALREEAARDIAIIEAFKARLPEIEAEGKAVRLITDRRIAERAIVLQVLRRDHDDRWTRTELDGELRDVEPMVVSDALERIHRGGVIHRDGEQVRATEAIRHLNDLEMVSI